VIEHGEHGVRLEVRNPVAATPPASMGDGHGLIGMREPVEAACSGVA
jgi:hypothetical protein